jgi:5-methylcytosine-specific restriction endonuclease McrA
MSVSQNKHPKTNKICQACEQYFMGTVRARFCEPCRKTRQRQQNPEKVAANNMKLRTRDPIDPELIKLVFKLYEYECMYCSSRDNLLLEHILPITRGGDNGFENLGVACRSCNSSKNNKTVIEFIEWRQKLVKA